MSLTSRGANKKKITHIIPGHKHVSKNIQQFTLYAMYVGYVCITKTDNNGHISHTCSMTTIKHLPFPGKWTVLWIKAGYFKILFVLMCQLKFWRSTPDSVWSHYKRQLCESCQSGWEYNRLLCENKGHSQWRLCQPLNFHVTESINWKSAQSPFIRGKCVSPVSWLRMANWNLCQRFYSVWHVILLNAQKKIE